LRENNMMFFFLLSLRMNYFHIIHSSQKIQYTLTLHLLNNSIFRESTINSLPNPIISLEVTFISWLYIQIRAYYRRIMHLRAHSLGWLGSNILLKKSTRLKLVLLTQYFSGKFLI
jgi:hypothetical protein